VGYCPSSIIRGPRRALSQSAYFCVAGEAFSQDAYLCPSPLEPLVYVDYRAYGDTLGSYRVDCPAYGELAVSPIFVRRYIMGRPPEGGVYERVRRNQKPWAMDDPSWLCATADHWTAVRYGGPLVRGSWAAASGGPFWAARTSCGNVRTVLERYQVPLSSYKRVWLNSDIWPLSTCLNLPLSAARNLTLPRACT
jgi:hypothetical protein